MYSLETHEIPRVARELGVDVSAGQYLHPDLQETYLRYANSAVNKDVISEGNIKKSTVSKQVQVKQIKASRYAYCTHGPNPRSKLGGQG